MSQINQNRIVAKFGGTSLADYDAMARSAQIIIDNPNIRLVVVSASAGVTNHLVTLTSQSMTANEVEALLAQIADVQTQILDAFSAPESVRKRIEIMLYELAQLAFHPDLLTSPSIQDEVLSFGERLSSTLFVQVLNHLAKANVAHGFDCRRVVKTDSQFGHAKPDLPTIQAQATSLLLPQLSQGICVTQGFIGQDAMGRTTTLGRGGSDYSAALLAEAIAASALQIWTDVAGIYTTDPRVSSGARAIEEMSFSEAAELATFGAKVLHPATMVPAIRGDIPVFVGSSLAPEENGTWITNRITYQPDVRALALRRDQLLLTVSSPNMLHATGFLARVFTILAKHELSVDLVTTSEISVALTIDSPPNSPNARITQACIQELSAFCQVKVESGLALIAIIGDHDYKGESAALSGIFDVMEQEPTRLICHGASRHNLCFLVPEARAESVIQNLHARLF